MKFPMIATVCAALSAAFVSPAAQLYSVPTTDAVPVLDGQEDACYSRTFVMCDFCEPVTRVPVAEQTEVKLLHDKKNLYGFIRCRRPDASTMNLGSPKADDGGIWNGDAIELLFAVEGGIRHFMLSPAGGLYDAMATYQASDDTWSNDTSWTSGMRIATSRASTSWCVEFALPLSAIPGEQFDFNAIRDRERGKQPSSWARLEQAGWRPRKDDKGKFGTLRLLQDPLPPDYVFDLPPPYGKNQAKIIWRERLGHKGPILYRSSFPVVVRSVSITPKNLFKDELLLNGNLGLSARLVWNMRHNYPGGDPRVGKRVPMDVRIRFELPEGVRPLRMRKTGESVRDGRKVVLYEQREKWAYNEAGWIGSVFDCDLPGGSKGVIRYSLKFADGEQPAEEIPFRVIDFPKEVRLPKRFMTGHYACYPRDLKQVREWAKSGANTFPVRGYGESVVKLANEIKAAGFHIRRGDYFWPGAKVNERAPYQSWTRDDESARALDIDGKPISQGSGYLLSPSYRGRMFHEAVAKEVEFAKATGVDLYCYDMERYVQKGAERGDFRPETLSAFRAFWEKSRPGTPAPDPRIFERDPAAHPEEHAAWVDARCGLWGSFFADMKREIAKGTGKEPRFSEWSIGGYKTMEDRHKSLQGRGFYEAFDFFEVSMYSGIDRALRQIERTRRNFAETFPGCRLDIVWTPSPSRLSSDPYYYTSAPELPDESKYLFMEAATMGAKGVYTFHVGNINLDYLRQFAEGVNLVAPMEDIILDGTSRDLKTNFPEDMEVTDKFAGKMQTWSGQKRVFARAITLGGRSLVSVGEYRELKPMTVTVDFPHAGRVRVTDLETGEEVAVLAEGETALRVDLPAECRCRLLLATEDVAAPRPVARVQGLCSPAGPRDRTRFELVRDGGDAVFRFETEDDTPCIVADAAKERDLEAGDRLEVFLSAREDLKDWYYCLEFDLRGRVLDYRTKFYRQMDYGWRCETLRTKVSREGNAYMLEARVSVEELARLGLDLENCSIGVFRADARQTGAEPDWYSAVPFPPGEPDFHRPVMLRRIVAGRWP